MKKSIQNRILSWHLFVSVILMPGCNKGYTNNSQSQSPHDSISTSRDTSANSSLKAPCINPSVKGRIIGFNPLMNFLNFDTSRFVKYDSTLGPGYLIEINNEATPDTVICYRIITNHFQYKPFPGNIASLYLFNQQYQDSLKIKFNFSIITNKTEIKPFASTAMDNFYFSRWLNFIKDKKEITMSCVSHQ